MRWGWMGGVVAVAAGVAGCRAASLGGSGAAAHDGGPGGVPSSADGGGSPFDGGAGGANAGGAGGGGGDDGVVPPPGGRILPVLNGDVHDTCATRTPEGWCWVSPRPQGSWLFDASSPRTAELWAVGYGGTVLHGTAAASGAPAAWALVDAGLTAELTAVSATADGAVWIGTHDGDVVRGDGAAGGWTTLPRPGLSQVSGLWAAGRDEAWAVGADSAVVYHWTGAGNWTPFDLGLDGVATVTGRAPDDVWMATGIGHWAHWDGARWQSGDIAIEFRSEYTPTAKEDLYFTRMGVLDDGTVWASALSRVDTWAGYFLAGGAWSLSEAYTMAGASMADHWASGARGSVMHVSPFGPDVANVIQVGDRPLLAGHANDGWVVADTTARHARFGQWEADPFLFRQTFYVAAPRPDDVWISGLNERYHGELAHWDGSGWSMFALGDEVRNPVPIALGTSGAWFAGTSLWHWDGQAIEEIPYPASLVPAGDWFATNVVATPAGNVWVVLGQGNPGPKLLLRFDGRRWHPAPLPAWVPYGYQSGFRGTSDRDLWVIGNSTLAHFDGDRWSDPVALPSSAGFEDIAPLTPNDVWAGPFHFDGARWTNTLTPPIDSLGTIYGSWAEASDDVWMTTSTGLRHWDGRSWSGPLAVPSFYSWVSLSGTGPGDVWISGAGGVIHGVTTRAAP